MRRPLTNHAPRGIASVEAAIILPIIVVLVFGFVEIGFYVNCHHLLQDAARQGARAAVRHENSNSQVEAAVLDAISNGSSVVPQTVTVRISKLDSNGDEQYQVMSLSDNENGEPIRITVTVDYSQFNSPSNFFGLANQSVACSVAMRRKN